MDCVDSHVDFPKMDNGEEGADRHGSDEQQVPKSENNAGTRADGSPLEEKDTTGDDQVSPSEPDQEESQSIEAETGREEGELDDDDEDDRQQYCRDYDDIVDNAGGIESRSRYEQELERFKTMDGQDEALLYQDLPRPLSPGEELYTLPKPKDYSPEPTPWKEDNGRSSSDSDSDHDNDPTKKKLRYGDAGETGPKLNAFNNPNAGDNAPHSSNADTEFGVRAKDLQSRRKRSNNVWVNVWAREEVDQAAQELENFGVTENKKRIQIQRGPESFSIDTDLVDAAPTRKRRHKSEAKSDGMESDDGEYYVSSDEAESSKASAEKALKRIGKPRLENFLQTKSDKQLKTFIARKLREKNVAIIGDTITLLGRDVAIKLLSETIKIQRTGGMLILSGARKRTPGGVFIHLLREDKTLDPNVVELVLHRDDGPARKTRLGSRRRAKRDDMDRME